MIEVNKILLEIAKHLPEYRLGGFDYIRVRDIKTETLIEHAKQKDGLSQIRTRDKAMKVLKTSNEGVLKAPMVKNHYKALLKAHKKGKVLDYIVRYKGKGDIDIPLLKKLLAELNKIR